MFAQQSKHPIPSQGDPLRSHLLLEQVLQLAPSQARLYLPLALHQRQHFVLLDAPRTALASYLVVVLPTHPNGLTKLLNAHLFVFVLGFSNGLTACFFKTPAPLRSIARRQPQDSSPRADV